MLGRVATTFGLPVVLSTVYVKHGMSGTNPELREVLPRVAEIDRTSLNSWEDEDFRAAVEGSATGDARVPIACAVMREYSFVSSPSESAGPQLRARPAGG